MHINCIAIFRHPITNSEAMLYAVGNEIIVPIFLLQPDDVASNISKTSHEKAESDEGNADVINDVKIVTKAGLS